jgi:DsbC/DsbD-like thiol-disulfide interchange protein
MRAIIFSICALLILAAGARAQDPSKAVTAKGVISTDKVQQGGAFQLGVVLDIGPTFHINSNKPSDPNLIPTKIELLPTEGITYGTIVYPKGEVEKFQFSEQPLSVYSHRVVIKVPASATAKLAPGQQTLRAKLRYQACNDQACFPPKTVEVTVPVEVVDARAKVSPANGDIFGAAKKVKGKIKGKK